MKYLLIPILFAACASTEDPTFVAEPLLATEHVIDSTWTGADGVCVGDIDGDGRDDIVTPWEQSNLLTVHYGDKKTPWVRRGGIEVKKAEGCFVADLDADGSPEVIGFSEHRNEAIVIWWADGTREEVTTAHGRRWLTGTAADVDGDGDLDIIGGGKHAATDSLPSISELAWFESGNGWAMHTIAPVRWVMSTWADDLDSDGDVDVLFTDRFQAGAEGARWAEQTATGWTLHTIQAGEAMLGHWDGAELWVPMQSPDALYQLTWDGTAWSSTAWPLPVGIYEPKAVGWVGPVLTFNGKHAIYQWDGTSWDEVFYDADAKLDVVLGFDADRDGDEDLLTTDELGRQLFYLETD